MVRQRNVTAPCPSCGADVSVEITTTGPVQYGTFKCDCGEEFEFENEFLGEATPAMNVTRSIESASNGQQSGRTRFFLHLWRREGLRVAVCWLRDERYGERLRAENPLPPPPPTEGVKWIGRRTP